MYDIAFDDVSRSFDGGIVALDHLSLDIGGGEMFGLVGPSGCGKTTALRILAGLDHPTSGRVHMGGTDVTQLETRKRQLGLVTQENQLIAHRTARRNISFPLELRSARARAGPATERVTAEAEGLGISHLLERSPDTLSEGERRTVQLARAVVNAPATLLMDEPFAHLEEQVRLSLRSSVLRIHGERGLTSLLVTASQDDAMALCDRVAVLFDGIVHQVGTPQEVYRLPATADVAAFFGEPSMNVVPAEVRIDGGDRYLNVLGRELRVWSPLVDAYEGRSVLVGFRAEDLEVGGSASHSLEVRIAVTEPLGHQTLAVAVTGDAVELNCVLPGRPPPIGMVLDLGVRSDRLHLFDPVTKLAFLHPIVDV